MNFADNGAEFPHGAGKQKYNRDTSPLLYLSPKDALTVKQSFEGIFVAGQSGSGKTSGPGQGLARAMLRNGYGFLVTTTKPDDASMWVNWAHLEGREKDVRIFSPEQPWRCGLLDYAYRNGGVRGGADTENVVSLLGDLHEQRSKSRQGGGESQFWFDSAKRQLGHCIDLLAFAGETISFAGINKILQSLPCSVDEVKSSEWQEKSYVNRLVDRGIANKKLARAQENDLGLAIEYALSTVPRMDEKLRSGIVATNESITFGFLRGTVAELCDGKTNLTPENAFGREQGAIIILDMPVKQFHDTGKFVQILWKRLWCQAAERRDTKMFPRPLCLFCDEAQNFVTKYDSLFQATARSARVCSVLMTQNLDALQSQIGKSETEALLASLNLKIFSANDHVPTNEWAAKKIGESWVFGSNSSVSLGEGNASGGVSESRRYIVEPSEFVRLRKGGEENDFLVDGIAFRSGRPFEATGANYIRVRFPQKIVSQEV